LASESRFWLCFLGKCLRSLTRQATRRVTQRVSQLASQLGELASESSYLFSFRGLQNFIYYPISSMFSVTQVEIRESGVLGEFLVIANNILDLLDHCLGLLVLIAVDLHPNHWVLQVCKFHVLVFVY